MKNIFLFSFLLELVLTGNMACNADDSRRGLHVDAATPYATTTDTLTNRLTIRIGSRTFSATLLNNPTAAAFKARLPLTIPMKELNGNEKFAQLSSDLPGSSSNPGTIQSGDLMLFGSNTLVLFYKTFRTPYSYTTLGRIENVTGLAAAVGTGNVTVTFELER
jgi:hypothetical protein